VKKRKAVGIQT